MYTNSSSPRAQGSAAPADPSLRTVGLHAGGAQSWLGVHLRLCGLAAGQASGLLALPLNLLLSLWLRPLCSIWLRSLCS